jgi:hypothetical protein
MIPRIELAALRRGEVFALEAMPLRRQTQVLQWCTKQHCLVLMLSVSLKLTARFAN